MKEQELNELKESNEANVTNPSDQPAEAQPSFADFALGDKVLRAVVTSGYTIPTPIQSAAIPHVLAGRDLLACAQTGTGKTAAFALPILERLMREPAQGRKIRVLVLAPTRELAAQIDESFRTYGKHTGMRTAVIYGGVSQRPQTAALQRGVDILIATPGRLLDLINQRYVDLRSVQTFVLDEADRMLDMGFIPDVKRLIKMLPGQRQTLLFSATVPPEVRTLSETLLNNPETISVARTSATAATVAQGVYLVDKRFKRQLLLHLLKNSAMERVIVFTGTKHLADRLERDLRKAGHRAEALHGNKSQNARERVLREFKSQRPPVLVATDIAARGLDVDGVSHVVNFDLPHVPETYVHRIGRTGRAGEEGIAVSFCGGDERAKLRAIERLIRQSIAVHQDQPKYQNESVNDLPASQSSDGSGSAESRELAPRPAYKPNGAPQGGAKPWKGQSAFGGMPGGGKKRFKGRGRRAGIKAARPKQGVGAN